MTCADAIMALFVTDDIVLRPAEIMRKTGRKGDSVRTTIKRLVVKGRLFHIAHSQYARTATTKTIECVRNDRIAKLEARVEQLERLMSDVVP